MLIIYSCPLKAFQNNKDNYKKLIHYNIENWGKEDGLNSNNLLSIYQSVDGLIWGASYEGLFSFDGLQFKIFNKYQVKEIQSNHISVIKGDQLGNIWLGTGKGLVKYQNGTFQNLATENYDFTINSLMIDNENNLIWIGTREKGLYIFDIEKNDYKKIDNPRFNNIIIRSIAKDLKGRVWVGSEGGGIGCFDNNHWKFYSKNDGLLSEEILDLYVDQKGIMFIASSNGLFYLDENKFFSIDFFKDKRIWKIKKDQNDNLWVVTHFGLFRKIVNRKNWEVLDKSNGLPSNDISDITFGKEGSFWVTSNSTGLIQLINSQFLTISENDGLTSNQISVIHQKSENKYLLGTVKGDINLLEKGNVVKSFVKTKIPSRINALLYDKDKNLWVISYEGLLRKYPDGREKLYTIKDGLPTNLLRVIFQDSKNNIWLGTRSAGLVKMVLNQSDDPKFKVFNVSNKSLNSNFIMSIDEGREGELIVGTNTAGMTIIKDEKEFIHYSEKNGLPSNLIFNIHKDNNDILWITTNEGLSRFDKEKFFNFSINEGLPNESLFDILEDEIGNFWLPTSIGIIKVEKQQLEDFVNTRSAINWKVYDKYEGLRNSECYGGTRSFKSKEGLLWIPSFSGVIVIKPTLITKNKVSPKVIITDLIIDDLKKDINNTLIVNPDKHRYVFNYSAVNLIYPEKVKFKYKIENYDNKWIEAGNKKQAHYTGLPFGEYTFKVMASNSDGVWSGKFAEVKFKVLPYFYQTWWFYVLILGLFGMIGYAYLQLKTYTIKKKSEELEKEVQERTKLLKQKSDESEILNRISSNLIAPIELEVLLKQIIESAVHIIPSAEKGSILLLKPESNILEAKASFGYPDWLINNIRIKVGEGQSGKAVQENKNFIENHLDEKSPPLNHHHEEWRPIKSLMVVLLRVKEKIIGTISLDNLSRYDAFSDHDLKILSSVAANASVAIERVRIYEELDGYKNNLEYSYIKLKELDEFKEMMTGMIIHDFKNSLNTVINFSKEIPTYRRLKSIHQAGKHMLNMVMNILDVQKFEKTSFDLAYSNHHIEKLINESLEQVSFLIEQKSLNISYQLVEAPMVKVEHTLVIRVLVNILTNAIKYSPFNGDIKFESELKESFVKILISDSGKGIPQEMQDVIFEKFTQVEAKKAGDVRSTGLGLTFCKMTIEAHGGEIGVESSKGGGSTFWFTIPIFDGHGHLDEEPVKKSECLSQIKELRLNDEEKAYLLPYTRELLKWDVYSYSEVSEILSDLKDESNPSILYWLNEMKEVLFNLNQQKYEELINID